MRGTVTDSAGTDPRRHGLAVNTASGTRSSAAVAVNGTYVLVVPAGRYEVAVATGAHEPWKKAIQVGVGQSLTQDIALKPGKLAAEVSVVATSAEAQVSGSRRRSGRTSARTSSRCFLSRRGTS
ncbi:MAG: carboxypeptidase regulatory-like domain-containing protein [Holophagales bacterium]|nr:carboxypeptidase regulatory-like domain-containing protein [Holophagales bacterium]